MHRLRPTLIATLLSMLFIIWGGTASGGDRLIRIKGSDTLAAVASEWGEAFSQDKLGLTINVSGGGSGNGIAALINGHVEIASTSRKLRDREKRLMLKKNQEKPYSITVGLDAVSVLVHNNNPLNGISLPQLAAIYGAKGTFSKWSDLGVTVPGCESGKIVRVSRKNNSGTYSFFRQTIFGKRAHFNRGIKTHGRSQDLVDHVADEPCAIGYSGMAFLNSSVKTLCVAKTSAMQDCVPPTAAFTLSEKYPLSRPLFMYTLGEPKGNMRDFLSWIRGSEGQNILRKAGFVSIPQDQ